jgi:hypothetical protein
MQKMKKNLWLSYSLLLFMLSTIVLPTRSVATILCLSSILRSRHHAWGVQDWWTLGPKPTNHTIS